MQLDVTKPARWLPRLPIAEREFGGLVVLVKQRRDRLHRCRGGGRASEYRPVFEVNVFGLIETTRLALPALRRRGGGRIVNLSSGAGLSEDRVPLLQREQFAVEGFSESLAKEVEPFGIRVTIVEPGRFAPIFSGAPSPWRTG